MDIVTQGLLGAGMAQAAAPARESRIAALAGAAAGLLPDIDALLRSPSDPLFFLEYHRYFTHALVFVPVGALVAAGLLWPLLRRRLSFARLYAYAFLGYCLAGLLDACTSYGTHLLWPFSDARIAWSVVSIVDPLFSLPLLAAVAWSVRTRRALPARIGLALGAAYLAFGAVQHQRAEALAGALVESRGQVAERLVVKPTFGNTLLWRSVYLADGRLYADGVRLGWPGGERVYPGESLPLADGSEGSPAGPATALPEREVRRFAHFADGLLVRHPARPDLLGDARFAMLPTSLRPLWGIARAATPTGVDFVTDRQLSAADRQRFLDMLGGRE